MCVFNSCFSYRPLRPFHLEIFAKVSNRPSKSLLVSQELLVHYYDCKAEISNTLGGVVFQVGCLNSTNYPGSANVYYHSLAKEGPLWISCPLLVLPRFPAEV